MLRSPAVAGQFYPDRPDVLDQALTRLIPTVVEKRTAIGMISPHAGYVYSGKVAGKSFARLRIPPEVVILGPNHHGVGQPIAVYHRGGWQTPLGPVPIAETLADAILAACPDAAADTSAHRAEHSLEVQVPFLQKLAAPVSIVPICLGRVPLDQLLTLGDGLATVLAGREPRPLIVASSDMTHYESGEEARRKDGLALERVLALDPEGLYRTVRDHRISMCGVLPAVVMLRAALALGATAAELVAYANSGEVTGDQRQVVGYAGVIVT
jgi:AmmeMemoRadiSam system protein B